MGYPCDTKDLPDDFQAAKLLARLLETELGYAKGHIDSTALRLLVQAKWSRISMLAHRIHGSDFQPFEPSPLPGRPC